MIAIDLKNITNGTISLLIDEVDFTQRASTYYFAIDKYLKKDSHNTHKVLTNLKQLFTKWEACLNTAFKEGYKSVYLPFDFTDEYIGFLKVDLLTANNVRLEYGYSEEIKGYSVSPSKAECLRENTLKNYDSISDSFNYTQGELARDIENINSVIDAIIVEIN